MNNNSNLSISVEELLKTVEERLNNVKKVDEVLEKELRKLEPTIDKIFDRVNNILGELYRIFIKYLGYHYYFKFNKGINVIVKLPFFDYHNDMKLFLHGLQFYEKYWLERKLVEAELESLDVGQYVNYYTFYVSCYINGTWKTCTYHFAKNTNLIYYKIYVLDNLPIILRLLPILIDKFIDEVNQEINTVKMIRTRTELLLSLVEKLDLQLSYMMRKGKDRISSVVR